ncbi:MAG: 3-hydroxyacyl-[acyl-carrier-protein] dehydratase FabZ [Deltaproteobacteria bacterium]|nr:MAG: 3-hydroxyacyl-[acyl-carrier-protein] dehydratase FabZ [Deltaproteobacteria bacterium]
MAEIKKTEEIDILEIMKMLPHRYPFVMVDKIIEINPGSNITGIKNVTINEPFFQGHFPARPVMPGVLILEGMAQVGGVMAFYSYPEKIGKELLFFAGIDKARFRKMVVPGDQVIMKVTFLKKKSRIMVMSGQSFVGETLVAEAEMMASFS